MSIAEFQRAKEVERLVRDLIARVEKLEAEADKRIAGTLKLDPKRAQA